MGMQNPGEGPGASATFGPPPQMDPPWQAPSAVEHELYEAKTRGDWPAYFDVLATTDLYLAVPRHHVEANPGSVLFMPYWNPRTGTQCLAVFTEGVLPAPVEDPVFCANSLGWYARVWEDRDPPFMVVNPGTPCEAVLPAGPAYRATWTRHHERALGADNGGCHHEHNQLRTLRIGGPLHGPVAHGLACGALLFVRNGELWNAMAYHGKGFAHERGRLKEWWGVAGRQDWLSTQERLLKADMVSDVWEFVLKVRRSLAREFAGPVGVEHWREVAERTIRHNIEQAAEVRITPEGVTKVEALTPGELESQIAGVRRLIGRITRYEARFRADGLLEDGAYVRSVEAWDYGRASGMARWGLGARFCTLPEAENAVLRAGRAAQATYRSWQDFSAGFILGRCLHFDDEEFGEWYQSVLDAHRVLTTDPASPWLNIPWKE
ncbi:DUF1266 domain-containing protein [Streptomyces sp. NPDC049577]|uniref:DUF1266 domain-containing protein n=1 Tax=Streptomyces sp. NPDC049577 TaxID=3155153 RepID=UPI003422BA97